MGFIIKLEFFHWEFKWKAMEAVTQNTKYTHNHKLQRANFISSWLAGGVGIFHPQGMSYLTCHRLQGWKKDGAGWNTHAQKCAHTKQTSVAFGLCLLQSSTCNTHTYVYTASMIWSKSMKPISSGCRAKPNQTWKRRRNDVWMKEGEGETHVLSSLLLYKMRKGSDLPKKSFLSSLFPQNCIITDS